MLVLSIRDLKGRGYQRPFFAETIPAAVRELQLGLRGDERMVRFGSDFQVYQLGEFDAETGELTPVPPKHLFDVSDVVQQPEGSSDGEDTSPR